MIYTDKDLEFISETNEYPNGANSPTLVKKYKCPCGKGFVTYSRVIGFGDSWGSISCDECKKKYFMNIENGNWIELIEK